MNLNVEGFDEVDEALIKASEDGLPVVERPFRELGERIGLSEEEVLERFEELVEEGVVRRFSVSLNHRMLGYRFNAMVVWDVAEEDVDRVGEVFAGFDFVTHCYERETVPGKWRFNVFTMVHGRSREECEEKIGLLSSEVGLNDFKVIYSSREFKKSGVKFPRDYASSVD